MMIVNFKKKLLPSMLEIKYFRAGDKLMVLLENLPTQAKFQIDMVNKLAEKKAANLFFY